MDSRQLDARRDAEVIGLIGLAHGTSHFFQLLLPAFILAEATMSFVGLGFPQDVATWGTMLQDASNVAMLADAPWMLAPALPIFLVLLAVQIAVRRPALPR